MASHEEIPSVLKVTPESGLQKAVASEKAVADPSAWQGMQILEENELVDKDADETPT